VNTGRVHRYSVYRPGFTPALSINQSIQLDLVLTRSQHCTNNDST